MIEKKIGFDKIVETLKAYSLSNLGKERINKIRYYKEKEPIRRLLEQADEFVDIIKNHDEFPTNHFYDAREYLNRIKIENTHILPEELLKLKRSLETFKSITYFFKKEETEGKFPELRKLVAQIKIYPSVSEEINRIINKNGVIKDSASADLKKIRNDLAQKQQSASKIINSVLKQAQKEGLIDKDTNVAVRNGKLLIPISSYDKNKIIGVVQDQSTSGKTAFIEPLKSIELQNQITQLQFAERREIIKILTLFADNVRPYIYDLINIYYFLAEIDFIRCRAKLAIELDASKPKLSDLPILDFRQAYHPLLYLTFKIERKFVVPLDIELNEKQRIILISGPNAGGKSVALKTVALMQYMVQCGLLIPVKPNSTVGIFNQILIDIGDEQSIENDLSTYSSHLLNMKNFISKGDKNTLILIDEFGTGTEPIMGAAIAEAILSEFDKMKVKGVITTHYTNLKHFAAASEGIENAAMLFDSKKLKPLFLLETGKPGSSYAFEISKSIGLPNHIIKKAEKITGTKQVQLERHLHQIEEDKRQIAIEKQQLIRVKKDFQNRESIFRNEQAKLLKDRKQIIVESNKKAEQVLAQANKLIENTIREIKTKKADKELTKNIRANFEEQKNIIAKKHLKEQRKLDEKIRKTQKKQNKNVVAKPKTIFNNEILIGDKVKIKNSGTIGQVESIKDKVAMVVIGNMRTFVKLKDLEKISNNQIKKQNKQQQTVRIEYKNAEVNKNDFMFGLDVRGCRGDEALQKVIAYLDKAIIANAKEFKILHGKGNGILKQIIREYLNIQDFVISCKDEKIQLGGAGITIVKLDFS